MDDRIHYLCRLRFKGAIAFVVWYTNGRDGFVRDNAGRLHAARTPDTLISAVGIRDDLWGSEEPAEYDFDQIRCWCDSPSANGIDCMVFLNAWNFLDNLASLHEGADSAFNRLSHEAACYDKLFWGNNLPAITPAGEFYRPSWRDEELAEIRSVFEAGLDLLNDELRVAGVFDQN